MSVSPLSSTDPQSNTVQNTFAERRQQFQALAGALQSGDLSDAQAAYANLQSLGAPPAGQAGSQAQNAFQAVGAALQSGDLAGAQAAFGQLAGAHRGGHGGHHHHGHGGGSQTGAPAGPNAIADAAIGQTFNVMA